MKEENRGFINTLGCWAMAAGAGALTFVLLLVLGSTGVIGSVFLAGLVFIGAGLFFQFAFLKPLPPAGSVTPGEDRGLRAVPPDDPAAVSVTYAARQRGETVGAAPGKASAAPEAAPASKPAPQPAAAAADADGTKPKTLSAPRGGQADDLKKIKGVGPKLESMLNEMGYYHFDQIANWSDAEVAWVDDNIEGFRGRVSRDNWVEQARDLAAGDG